MIFLRIALCLILVATASIAAFAKTAANPLAAGGKHDSKTPIEVTSDALEVLQEQNRAIFTGHVVVIQGDMRLKSEKMTIDYARQSDASGDDAKKPARHADTGENPVGGNAIKKIEAEGSVFLSTPEETASGDHGTYDVEHQEIHLDRNVVLTRGLNTLKGENLVYNMATGKSRLTGGSQPASDSGKSTGRVRALFVPDKK